MAENNDREIRMLDIIKKLFKEKFELSIEIAKEIIEIQNELEAVSSNIPSYKDEKIPGIPQEKHKIEQPVINTVRLNQTGPLVDPDDSDDGLPF